MCNAIKEQDSDEDRSGESVSEVRGLPSILIQEASLKNMKMQMMGVMCNKARG